MADYCSQSGLRALMKWSNIMLVRKGKKKKKREYITKQLFKSWDWDIGRVGENEIANSGLYTVLSKCSSAYVLKGV